MSITSWASFFFFFKSVGSPGNLLLNCIILNYIIWSPKQYGQSLQCSSFLKARGLCICIHPSNIHTTWNRNTSGFRLHKIISENRTVLLLFFSGIWSCICWIHYLYIGMQECIFECRTVILLCSNDRKQTLTLLGNILSPWESKETMIALFNLTDSAVLNPETQLYNHYRLSVFCFWWFNNCCHHKYFLFPDLLTINLKW